MTAVEVSGMMDGTFVRGVEFSWDHTVVLDGFEAKAAELCEWS